VRGCEGRSESHLSDSASEREIAGRKRRLQALQQQQQQQQQPVKPFQRKSASKNIAASVASVD